MATTFKYNIGVSGSSTALHLSLSGNGVYLIPPLPTTAFTVLYNDPPRALTTQLATITANGHQLKVDLAYHGTIMATSTVNQVTTQFTVNSALSATITPTISTADVAIGPEWFRHRLIGLK